MAYEQTAKESCVYDSDKYISEDNSQHPKLPEIEANYDSDTSTEEVNTE